MTKFMKFEAIVWYILLLFGYACGILGALGVIGFAGSLEWDRITIPQFWMYEIHAFMLIGISYAVYYIREHIRVDLLRRERIIQRRARRLALVK